MSTVKQTQSDIEPAGITEDAISQYLQTHRDFFERHPALLAKLNLPHSTGNAAVSLVERQVSLLRQQNLKLERQFKELVDVARSNDLLAEKIHSVGLLLLAAKDREEIITLLEDQLRSTFNCDRSVLVLFDDEAQKYDEGTFLRVLARDDAAMRPFKTFMDSKAPRCGRIRDAQRDYLFGADDLEIGSVALVPLGPKTEVGFFAIGSRNADHFHPGKSIDFLSRLGELVACALRK